MLLTTGCLHAGCNMTRHPTKSELKHLIRSPTNSCCTTGLAKALPSISQATSLQRLTGRWWKVWPNTVPSSSALQAWALTVGTKPSPLLWALNVGFSLNELGTRWVWSPTGAEKQSINNPQWASNYTVTSWSHTALVKCYSSLFLGKYMVDSKLPDGAVKPI